MSVVPDLIILKSGEFFYFWPRRKEKKQLYVTYDKNGYLLFSGLSYAHISDSYA